MDTPCNACLRGPSKIDGHAGLLVRSLGAASIVFECRSCGLLWSRSYSANDCFAWERFAERVARSVPVGVTVPSLCASPAVAAHGADRGHAGMEGWLAIQGGWARPRRSFR